MRPDQQEMAPIATWVAMAALALEARKAPSVRLRLGQLQEGRHQYWHHHSHVEMVAMVSTEHMDLNHLMEQTEAVVDMM